MFCSNFGVFFLKVLTYYPLCSVVFRNGPRTGPESETGTGIRNGIETGSGTVAYL